MEFDNSFEVPLPPAQAWPVLTDVRRVAPCMPGAELTEIVDDRTYSGKVAVRLGPVSLSFAGVVTFEELDNANTTVAGYNVYGAYLPDSANAPNYVLAINSTTSVAIGAGNTCAPPRQVYDACSLRSWAVVPS